MKLTLWGHTKKPRRVRGPWYILDRKKPPTPSKNDIYEGHPAGCEYSELILHRVFVVRTLTAKQFEELRFL